jgi:hypothetical protein
LNVSPGFTDASDRIPEFFQETSAVRLADVDGDGDLDLFVTSHGFEIGIAPRNRLLLNDGAGVFTLPAAVPPATAVSTAVAAGDVDGDGAPDLVFANAGSRNALYLNAGPGRFEDATAQLPPDEDDTRAVALGDVDGDGDLDALFGNGRPDPMRIGPNARLYLNAGAGVFSDASAQVPQTADDTYAVALADLDGDGDLDAYVGNTFGHSFENTNRLYLNSGGGTFVDATPQIASNFRNTGALAVGDVDRDGDLDVLEGNGVCCPHPNVVQLNDGNASFTASATFPDTQAATRAVALGDIDADGDLDAVAGNGAMAFSSSNDPDQLYLNGGSGQFADVSFVLPATPAPTLGVAFADVDGDFDLDLVLAKGTKIPFATFTAGRNHLLLNDGQGLFSDVAGAFPPHLEDSAAVLFVDLDGDADPDAVFAVQRGPASGELGGTNRVYANTTRQLAWRGLPRVGQPLVMGVFGPAGSPWILAAALGTGATFVPHVGTVLLDPATLVVAGFGVLDGDGLASPVFQVPPQPALEGVELFWQAYYEEPRPRLSNLEVTELTGF